MEEELKAAEITPAAPGASGSYWHWVFILAVFTIAVLAFWWF